MHDTRPGQRDIEGRMPSLVYALRRRWGVAFTRANAQLLLDRLAFVGRGASAAMDRRVGARAANAMRRRQLQAWATSHALVEAPGHSSL